MQRHGNEGVGEYRLVKKNGVDAVGKEHRAAVALREPFFNEGMAPPRDLFNGFFYCFCDVYNDIKFDLWTIMNFVNDCDDI